MRAAGDHRDLLAFERLWPHVVDRDVTPPTKRAGVR